MNKYQTHTLSNGLQIVHCHRSGSVSYCGFIVNVGSRDEHENEYGLAHLVEHTIFKGTSKRKAYHIRNRMEKVGGELNAFTSKEETVVYSIYPSVYQERAMELLGDLVANASFPDGEFEKEKEVVIEEIEMYRDTPSELIYDEFENKLFEGHALGHNILGTCDGLKQLSSHDARAFLSRYYNPRQMVFFSLGETPFPLVVKWAERYYGGLTDVADQKLRVVPAEYRPFEQHVTCNTHQVHVMWGRRTYNLYEEKRLPILLLNNMLGGPCMNSLLNVALREQSGYVYTVESTVTNYTDTGVLSIYFGTDMRHVKKCIQRVRGVIDKLKDEYITESRLNVAKKQYLGQLLVAEDNNEGLAMAIGKGFLRHGAILTSAEQVARIESISIDAVRDAAYEMLDVDSWSMLAFEP